MAEQFPSLLARGFNSSSSGGNGTSNGDEEKFKKFINELVLQNSIQNRTAILILASFNVAAVGVMIGSIMWDAWQGAKRRRQIAMDIPSRLDFLRWIHPAEILPLALAMVVMVQSFIFIGIQSTGMKEVLTVDCKTMSQIFWPAIWTFPFTVLVFSIEIMIRGFKRVRFAPRGPWNNAISWAVIAIMIVVVWIPSSLDPFDPKKCLANLIWWSVHWDYVAIPLIGSLIGLFVIIGCILVCQLVRAANVDREERISASRAVYYLTIISLLMVILLPFFVPGVRRRSAHMVSKMAAVALNISGIVMLFLHMILRSNADATAIRPFKAIKQRRQWRLFGSTDLDMGAQMRTPLAIEKMPTNTSRWTRSPSENYRELLSPEGVHPDMDIRSPVQTTDFASPNTWPTPLPTAPAPSVLPARTKATSYSVFPSNEPHSRKPSQDDVALLPPRPMFVRGHNRDSSTVSSATVQIGLRLSHGILPHGTEIVNSSIPHLPVQSPNPRRSPFFEDSEESQDRGQGVEREESEESLELPIQAKSPSPLRGFPSSQDLPPSAAPTPIRSPNSPWPMKPDNQNNRGDGNLTIPRLKDFRMKSLPPIPGRPYSNVSAVSDARSSQYSIPEDPGTDPWYGQRGP